MTDQPEKSEKKKPSRADLAKEHKETYIDIITYVKLDEDGNIMKDESFNDDPEGINKPSVTPSPERLQKVEKD